MRPIKASELACAGFGLAPTAGRPTDAEACAACAAPLNGMGVPFVVSNSFGDIGHFANRSGRTICGCCDTLMRSRVATMVTGSGVVTVDSFSRLLSNRERLAFFMNPPEPPFAVSLITTHRQHVWWMARVSYSKDLIPIQFGHRQLIVDRPKALAAATAILEYEAEAQRRDHRPTYVFVPMSRDLKSSTDGRMTFRFQSDASEAANARREVLKELSIGDIWAAQQVRAACREMECSHPNAAFEQLKVLSPAQSHQLSDPCRTG